MKIGITERGDAALDLTWTLKIHDVDAAVLITKCINEEFIEKVLRYKHKLIVHATCTGLGGTVYEPNVPEYYMQLTYANTLVSHGFPRNQVIIRIDPIIPTDSGIQRARYVLDYAIALEFKKFRVSVIDMYPHVRERIMDKKLNIPFNGFRATKEQFDEVSKLLADYSDYDITCCAEPALKNVRQVGCISTEVLDTLGIDYKSLKTGSNQRKDCLCLSCKTELLSNKRPCPNDCIYCYWKKQGE